MPSLSDHHSKSFAKIILIGDSGSGKTGALASLARAGYRLGILDFDNGLDILANILKAKDPKALANVNYLSCYDDKHSTKDGKVAIKGKPVAFANAIKALDDWPDLGSPAEWGPDSFLVIDSLTMMANACMDYVQYANNHYGQRPTLPEYGTYGDLMLETLSMIAAESFKTNVIVIAHLKQVGNVEEEMFIYPNALGQMVSTNIGQYFNNIIYAKSSGTGNNQRRKIFTQPRGSVLAKNSNPFVAKAEYDLEDGLAQFFSDLRGGADMAKN